MKCQKCPRPLPCISPRSSARIRSRNCTSARKCARNICHEPRAKTNPRRARPRPPRIRMNRRLNRECEVCGIKFVEFRNSGRLGCPHDYQEFRDELTPLLENIHGETRHCGKTPRRLPQSKQTQSELIQLRKQLQQAVTKEAYEEAARLRDRSASWRKADARRQAVRISLHASCVAWDSALTPDRRNAA